MSETAYYERILQEDINVGIEAATKRNPGGGTLVGTQVGIHTFAIGQTAYYNSSAQPGAISAGGVYTTTILVPGSTMGSFVMASFDLDLQGITLTGYVSEAGTVEVVFYNGSGAAVTLATGTLSVIVFKYVTTQAEEGV